MNKLKLYLQTSVVNNVHFSFILLNEVRNAHVCTASKITRLFLGASSFQNNDSNKETVIVAMISCYSKVQHIITFFFSK